MTGDFTKIEKSMDESPLIAAMTVLSIVRLTDIETAKAWLDLAVAARFGQDQIGAEYAEGRILSSLKTFIPFSLN